MNLYQVEFFRVGRPAEGGARVGGIEAVALVASNNAHHAISGARCVLGPLVRDLAEMAGRCEQVGRANLPYGWSATHVYEAEADK
ncbi:MAG: hypothetical protein AAFP26_11095, partial [Planctomycetota bacterium]